MFFNSYDGRSHNYYAIRDSFLAQTVYLVTKDRSDLTDLIFSFLVELTNLVTSVVSSSVAYK